MKPNPYYDPQHFNLELVGMVDWDSDLYGFDMTIVWVDSDGQYYTASDSGCSCPSPFENLSSIEDLEKVTWPEFNDQLNERLDEIRARCEDWYARGVNEPRAKQMLDRISFEIANLVTKVAWK